jgi:hypothetical protein
MKSFNKILWSELLAQVARLNALLEAEDAQVDIMRLRETYTVTAHFDGCDAVIATFEEADDYALAAAAAAVYEKVLTESL